VISVGAVNSLGGIAGFSSRGPTADGRTKPDVCAMGVSTVVATDASDTSIGNSSGTSFSAPIIAGACALILEANTDWSPMDVLEALRQSANNREDPDNTYGWGIPDLDVAIRRRLVIDGDSSSTMPSSLNIPLRRGWNLVSNPFTEAVTLKCDAFPNIIEVFTYSPLAYRYNRTDTLGSLEGAFVLSDTDTVIKIDGEFRDTLSLTLPAGWHILPMPAKYTQAEDFSLFPTTAWNDSLFDYNVSENRYIVDNRMIPGDARWIFLEEAASIYHISE
jgi:subtilisin family serine protease